MSIGLGEDGTYYCTTDFAGRASFHELIVIFGEIEYESSITFRLDLPKAVDPVLTRYRPKWVPSDIKISGGGGLTTIMLRVESEDFVFDRDVLEAIFSKPNLGHDEVYLEIPQRFSIW